MNHAILKAAAAGALLTAATAQAFYASISIDGDFADWTNVPVVATDPADNSGSIDFATLQVANDATNVYIRYTLHEPIDPNQTGGGTFLAIDEDNNIGTGFDLFGLGIVGSEASWQNDAPFEQAAGVFNTGNGLTNATFSALPYAAVATSVEIRISRSAGHAVGGTPVFPGNGGSVGFYVWTDEGADDIMGGSYVFSQLITQVVFGVSTVENVAAMQFDSQDGVTYQLQYSTNLLDPDWVFSGYQVTGNGGTLYLYDPTGFSTQKTYRIFVP